MLRYSLGSTATTGWPRHTSHQHALQPVASIRDASSQGSSRPQRNIKSPSSNPQVPKAPAGDHAASRDVPPSGQPQSRSSSTNKKTSTGPRAGNPRGSSNKARPSNRRPPFNSRSRSSSDEDDFTGITLDLSHDDMFDDLDEDAGVVEQPGDEAITDPDMIEKLIFGNKDFTAEDDGDSRGASPGPSSTTTATTTSATRLSTSPKPPRAKKPSKLALLQVALAERNSNPEQVGYIPSQLATATVSLAEQKLVSQDPDVVLAILDRVGDVISDLPPHLVLTHDAADESATPHVAVRALTSLLATLRSCCRSESEAADLEFEDVTLAVMRVPSVLKREAHDIRERLQALGPMTGIDQGLQLVAACTRHPELLVADLEDIRKKLLLLRNTTGLTGLPALDLMTPHMFPGL